MDDHFLYLSDDALDALGITTAEAVDAIERAIRGTADGTVWTAPKAAVLPGDGRYIMATLSASDAPQVVVTKTVMVSPRNAGRVLPGINGVISVLDAETGLLRAIVGANWVTAIRTAALSAVVAKRLADPESRSVAFVGTGVQASSHLDAFADLFPLGEVRIAGRGRANIDRLAGHARRLGLAPRVATTPREAIEGADLVVSSITLDYAVDPFLDARWMKPGAFAAITDLAIPWVPEGMDAFDGIVIDDLAQERASEKKMVDPVLIAGDLAGLVSGALDAAHDPARRHAFVFRGMAVGDFALAALACGKAVAAGQGIRIPR